MDQAWPSRPGAGADARPDAELFGPSGPGWIAPRAWPGSTVAVIASGPSLTRDDCDHVRARGWRAIAINRSRELAPWADILYACDAAWWRSSGNAQGYQGLKVGLQAVEFRDVRTMKWQRERGLDHDPAYLSTGGNSGHQAMNLAYHLGAARIVLLGFDCGAGPAGESHWHGDHGPGLRNPQESTIARWRDAFTVLAGDLAAEHVEVINASRRTALACFRRAAPEDIAA